MYLIASQQQQQSQQQQIKTDDEVPTMAASDAPPVVDEEDAPVPLKQRTQPHLMPQDAKTVDPSKLTALSPEVVSVKVKTMLSEVLIVLITDYLHTSYYLHFNTLLYFILTTLSLTYFHQLTSHYNHNLRPTDFSPSHNQCGNDWPRGSREKYCRQSDIRRPNGAIQE